jgi:hypothetical protein
MSQSYKLVNNESALQTYVYVADFEHIKNNATVSKQVTIGTIPAGGAVSFAYAYEESALVGASDITLDVGTSAADPDEFIDAWDADAGTPACNTGDACVQVAGNSTYLAGWKPVGISATATPILAEWNGTVASLTAGKVIVVVGVINPGNF